MQKTKRFFSLLLAGVAIWATCSLAKADGERRHHHRLDLTDEQKRCLEGLIGKPGEGEKPSREEMTKAFDTCGIPKPPRPPHEEGEGFAPPEGAATGGSGAPAFD